MDFNMYKNVEYPLPEPLKPGIVFIHFDAEKEIKKQFDTSGQRDRFRGLYLQRLEALIKYKSEAVRLYKKWFENLKSKKAKDLCCMNFGTSNSQFPNYRIIYCIEGNYIILLAAFIENNDGDYDTAISTARQRRISLKGGI